MDSTNSSTIPSLKTQAKLLRQHLAEQGIELGHVNCLHAVASSHGYKNWNIAKAVHSSKFPTGTVPEGAPYCVILMRAEWSGDPMLHDPIDYFGRSFLDEDGEGVSGDPDAVSLHEALCRGEELPHILASRLMAICYSKEDLEAAWQPLQEAVKSMAPMRRVALGDVFNGNRWKVAKETATSGLAPQSPAERAYRRGVTQTLGRLLRQWESNSSKVTFAETLEQMKFLLKTSLVLRSEDREIPLYLNELFPERGVGTHNLKDIEKGIRKYYKEHGTRPLATGTGKDGE